jgi:hypothetical protein
MLNEFTEKNLRDRNSPVRENQIGTPKHCRRLEHCWFFDLRNCVRSGLKKTTMPLVVVTMWATGSENQKFISKYNLNSPLLVDTDGDA